MSDYIEVVENKRGRRRRNMTAKQRKYFGKRRHHKKNPSVLATLAGNPRRDRNRRYHHGVRHHRRHRNPGILGGLGKVMPFDLRNVLEVGGGIAISKYGPQLVKKYVWSGMPTSGVGGYAVRLAATVAFAQALKMVTKSNRTAENIMLGGVGSILYDMFTEYAAPSLGLTGYSDRIRVSDVSSALNGGGIGGYTMPMVKSRLGTLPSKYWG